MQKILGLLAVAVPWIAGGCGGLEPSDTRVGRPYTPEHRRAVGKVEARVSPWWLTGGWRQADSGSRDIDSDGEFETLEVAAEDGRMVTRAALASVAVASGKAEQAVEALGQILEHDPTDARLWNDYGVALALSVQDGASRWFEALEAFARAVEIDPELLPPRFNLAALCEKLTLFGQASEQWRAYLERDSSSAEAEHARARLAVLSVASPPLPDETALALEIASRGTSELVQANPALIRRILEGPALREWAERELNGDPAAGVALANLVRVARELAARNGDPLAADTFEAIDRLSPSPRARAARAVRAYGEGLDRRQERNCTLAERHFESAARELQALAIPFALRAELKAEMCRFWGETDGPSRAFGRLRTAPQTARYPLLRAEAAWMLANAEGGKGYPSRALALREEAAESLRRAGEWEAVALLETWMAESYLELGQTDHAFQRLFSGLHAASQSRKPEVRTPLFSSIGDRSLDSGWARAALLVHREQEGLLANATDGYLLADARVSLAAALRALGRSGEALAALDQAAEAERTLPDPMAVTYTEARADELRIAIWSDEDPQRARDFVDSALARHESVDLELPRSSLLLERSRLLRKLGDPHAAREAASAALGLLERSRGSLAREDRVSYFERARAVLDELLELELEGRASAETLFDLLEQAHGRGVVDGWMANTAAAPTRSGRMAGALPPETVALVFHRLPSTLLVLRARADELKAFRLAALTREDEKDVEELIKSLRAGKTRRRGSALAEKLFDRLLAPVIQDFPESPLLIVPDGLLGRLPFAALIDRRNGRAVVETHVVSLAPALGIAAAASQVPIAHFGSALTLGNPAFDTRRLHASSLPAAEREASEVAALFERGTALLGPAATKSALVAGLPGSQVLHISAHGVVNPRDPRFSFLALAVEGEDDGLLYAHELASLPLDDTRLVYLSVCESAAGSVSQIEGPLSLARAFLEQRVPAVIGAVWKVNDVPAEAFARLFYNRLRQGLSPSEALTAAQREAIASENRNLASPATWAAFQAYGAPPPAKAGGNLR